jgi:hypothetical protein
MKKFFLFISMAIALLPVYSQTANDSVPLSDSLSQATEAVKSSSSGTSIMDTLIAILVIAVALFIVGHMLYVLFRTKRFADQEYSREYFLEYRKEKNMPEESSGEENEKCDDLLGEVFLTWTHIEEDEEGNELRKPKKMKEIIKSGAILDEVIRIAPTHASLIETLNEYKEVIASNEKRSFDGSKKLIGLGVGVAILMSLISMDAMGGFMKAFFSIGMYFIVPSLIYIVSSYTPQFLIDKRAQRGGGNVSTGLVAVAMGILGSGVTVRTHYTDGTHEDDNSGHMIAWVLGLIMMVIVAFTIIIWSFINYLRNYVLYF